MLPTIIILRNNVETGKILGTSEKLWNSNCLIFYFMKYAKTKINNIT